MGGLGRPVRGRSTTATEQSGVGWVSRRRRRAACRRGGGFSRGWRRLAGVSWPWPGWTPWGSVSASAQAAPPKLEGDAKGTKVVVLGAGLAGMTAAYELTKAGYSVQIIEARAFAGGRCQMTRKGFQHTDLVGNSQTCEFDEGLYINHGPWRIPVPPSLHPALHQAVRCRWRASSTTTTRPTYISRGATGRWPASRSARPDRRRRPRLRRRDDRQGRSKGQLDGPLTQEDRDLFVAYMINEAGCRRPTWPTLRGPKGAASTCIPAPRRRSGPGQALHALQPVGRAALQTPGGC